MITKFPKSRLFILFFFISIICGQTLMAQSTFRPGYYITWDNDTVYGLIDYRGEVRNSRICEFKENQEQEVTKLDATEIQSYRFIDDKFYVSKELNLPNLANKTVFVEFLVNGIVNLYFYRDLNNYMYLIEKDGKIYELSKKGINNNENSSFRHIGILKAIYSDCNEIEEEINNVNLNHKSLIEITNKYHDCVCSDTLCVFYKKNAPKTRIRIAPVILGGVGELHFDKGIFSNYQFDKTYFPSAGMLFSLSFPYWNEKLSFEVEADFSKFNNHGTYTDETSYKTDYYETYLDFWAFQPSIGLKYTFSQNKIKPTISLAPYMNYLFSSNQKVVKRTVNDISDTTYESEETPLASNFFGISIQAGCDYKLNNNKTMFTNLRVYRTVFKEAGVSTLFNSVSIGVGMYISNDN